MRGAAVFAKSENPSDGAAREAVACASGQFEGESRWPIPSQSRRRRATATRRADQGRRARNRTRAASAHGDWDRRKWYILAAICVAQFMVVLDIAVVNVALPSIRTDLHFTGREPAVGAHRPTPSSSAASCCSAAAWPTCSAAAACS